MKYAIHWHDRQHQATQSEAVWIKRAADEIALALAIAGGAGFIWGVFRPS